MLNQVHGLVNQVQGVIVNGLVHGAVNGVVGVDGLVDWAVVVGWDGWFVFGKLWIFS